MTEVFGSVYTELYDLVYKAKDYHAECDAIESLLRGHGSGAYSTLLDLGCGTGSHALALAKRGYQVTGVDRSAAMLEHARGKTAGMSGSIPEFVLGDVGDVRLGRTFDAVLMMFAVLGYQTTTDQVLAALRTAREHLRPGGLLIGDVWFGPAVLRVGTSDRWKVIENSDGQVLRASSGTVDPLTHTCRVRIEVWRTSGDRVVDHVREEHAMRFFFPLEIEHLLLASGLELRALRSFDDLAAAPGPETWNVWLCARAV